ncbi:MAG: hypothetical protein PHY73_04930, partial [Candidatus Omnitrophica bacterium]|nr:hypothetical protein [Candidatus Omnitrophota bacterium]
MNKIKESFKIALIDLNHMTLGVHTNTAPLGLGLIAHYLKKNISKECDVRLFKNPKVFSGALARWKPDVLGMAQYVWNTELNHHMAKLVKEMNPECLTIAGGPNLYLTSSEKIEYLKEKDFIDFCISYDGEIPFTELVKRFVNGKSINEIKDDLVPGTYALSRDKKTLQESSFLPPRIKSLDVFGAIYADGFFDEFLDKGFHPFLQTHRGCPFKCTY